MVKYLLAGALLLLVLNAFSGIAAQTAAASAPAEGDAGKTKEAAPAKKSETLDDFEKQLQKELEVTPDKPLKEEAPSAFWQFIKTLLTLAFLLVIFYGVFRIYQFKKQLPSGNKSALNTIYEYPLGPNRQLTIIEMANKLLILGVSDQSINLLSEITDKNAIDRIKLDCAEDNAQVGADFLTELSRAIKTNIKTRWSGRQSSVVIPPEQGGQRGEGSREATLEKLKRLSADKNVWRDKL